LAIRQSRRQRWGDRINLEMAELNSADAEADAFVQRLAPFARQLMRLRLALA
jgi:hypothetical protein